jgi:hypothetical protein
MDQLIIKLTGKIQSSNFDEWKNDLIAQIQSTNTELTTDDDFGAATRHVKLFKAAEKSLKEAKQSAIDQAADIQRLFTAIDDISEEARQARLSLERQIKARKLEIKKGILESGIDLVRAFIDMQSADFQMIEHFRYLDRNRFESVVRGKAGIKGMQFAIDGLCDTIKMEISQKAAEVTNNGVAIDTLPSQYQLLFPDRHSLIALTQQALNLTIDKRIALFNEENTKRKAEKVINELKKLEEVDLNPDIRLHPESVNLVEKEKYRLVIDILSSKETAIEIARSIRQAYGDNDNASISSMKLTRLHDYT